jgi:hypothetical protein
MVYTPRNEPVMDQRHVWRWLDSNEPPQHAQCDHQRDHIVAPIDMFQKNETNKEHSKHIQSNLYTPCRSTAIWVEIGDVPVGTTLPSITGNPISVNEGYTLTAQCGAGFHGWRSKENDLSPEVIPSHRSASFKSPSALVIIRFSFFSIVIHSSR